MKKTAYVLCLNIFFLCGCACPPTDPVALQTYHEINDPFEPANRAIFAFNMTADEWIVEPVAKGYRAITPQILRTGVRNFFKNLKQPVYLTNALLQLNGTQAWAITQRFVTNTLFGFFGMADTASELDIPIYEPDFGQTLYVWGVKKSGPYIVLPLIGPSNVRDAAGWGVDAIITPVDLAFRDNPGLLYSKFAAEGFTSRENAIEFLDSLEKSSTDLYATMRSMYRQNRVNQLKNTPVIIGSEETAEKNDYEFDFPTDDEEY